MAEIHAEALLTFLAWTSIQISFAWGSSNSLALTFELETGDGSGFGALAALHGNMSNRP